MHFMNTKGVEYSAAVPAARHTRRSVRSDAASFARSKRNPLNQSRTSDAKISGHAPSPEVLQMARVAARDLAELVLASPQAWKFVDDTDDATVTEIKGGSRLPPSVSTARTFGRGGGNAEDFCLLRAVATVHGTVDSVLDLLRASTTDELVSCMSTVFGKHFDTGVVLNKLTCSTPPSVATAFATNLTSKSSTPHTFTEDDTYAVHWLRMRAVSTLGAVDNRRDATVVAFQDAFEVTSEDQANRIGRAAARASSQPRRRLIGVHTLLSIDLADVPELPASEATDRVRFRNSGFVVESTGDAGIVRVSLLLSLLPDRQMLKAPRKYRKWLRALAACVSNLEEATRPPLALEQVARRQWKQSNHCYICLKVFRALRRCHHCRFCGEAVCGACSGFVGGSSTATIPVLDSFSDDHLSSGSSGSGRGSVAVANAPYTQTRACTSCMYELEQNRSPKSEGQFDHASEHSSSESLSSDMLSHASTPYELALPDFDDILDGNADSEDRYVVDAQAAEGRSPALIEDRTNWADHGMVTTAMAGLSMQSNLVAIVQDSDPGEATVVLDQRRMPSQPSGEKATERGERNDLILLQPKVSQFVVFSDSNGSGSPMDERANNSDLIPLSL